MAAHTTHLLRLKLHLQMLRVNSPKYYCHVNRLCDWINAAPNYFHSHYSLSTTLREGNVFSRVCLSFRLQDDPHNWSTPSLQHRVPLAFWPLDMLNLLRLEPHCVRTALPLPDALTCVHHVARTVSKADGWHSAKMPSFLNCFIKGSNCNGNNRN